MSYREYRDLALGYLGANDSPPGIARSSPEVFSPCVQVSKKFEYQSYFDNTLLEQAILPQPPNQAIVPSTKAEVQLSGYSLGLHPSSQTPVAVEFLISGRSAGSSTLILKPGQILTPTGLPPGATGAGAFSGFRWGLPFGWLGGGVATLVVFQTPESHADWPGNMEVIFHRVRVPVYPVAEILSADKTNARRNWPLRFPWTQAIGNTALTQAGSGVISLEPTRTLMVLRGLTTLATAANVRLILQATNDVGLDSAGAAVNTNPIFEDITWNSWSRLGTSGNIFTVNPAQMYTGIIARVSADDGGLACVDASGAASFPSTFIDFVRYGRL